MLNLRFSLEYCGFMPSQLLYSVGPCFLGEQMIFLRQAELKDFAFFLKMKSEDSNIHWSGHNSKPEPRALEAWFGEQLHSEKRKIYLAFDIFSQPVGCLYVDLIDFGNVEISYGISADFGGRGFGKKLIAAAIDLIQVSYPQVRRIDAWIFLNNTPSIKIVQANGFVLDGKVKPVEFHGQSLGQVLFSRKIDRIIIIGEAGVNHNGDINLAKKLIDVAAHAGVDYVKFQTWKTEELVHESATKAEYQKRNDGDSSQYQMLKSLELSYDQFSELSDHARLRGVQFLSTPDDFPSLNFLSDELNLKLLKIGSGELCNIPFLKAVGNKKKDVILSTGMGNISEVERAYYTLLDAGAKSVSLLHCTSNYPAPMNSANLHAMNLLKSAFNCKVGYSDHTEGIEISIAAAALGAKIIEKHYTTDRTLPGPDHVASIEPAALQLMVSSIRNVELAISGDGMKLPHQSEIETKKVVSKGLYSKRDIQKGETIRESDIALKRPVTDLSPYQLDLIVGLPAKRNIGKNTAIKLGDIEFE